MELGVGEAQALEDFRQALVDLSLLPVPVDQHLLHQLYHRLALGLLTKYVHSERVLGDPLLVGHLKEDADLVLGRLVRLVRRRHRFVQLSVFFLASRREQ